MHQKNIVDTHLAKVILYSVQTMIMKISLINCPFVRSLNQYASYDDQNKKSFCATHAYWYGEIERERKWQGCIIKCLKHFLNSYASSLRNFTSDLFCQKFWMMSRLLKYNCKVQTVSVEEYKKIFCHLYLWTDFVLIHD